MDETSKEALKAGAKALENLTDVFSKLAGPLAEEVGLALGDKAREYRLKNAIKILRRTKRMLADAGIPPREIPPRLFLPAMEAASLEDDKDLQERWAALLANLSGSGRQYSTIVLPSFIEILKALNQSQAFLLDYVYKSLKLPERREGHQGVMLDRDADLRVTSTGGLTSLEIGAKGYSYFAVEIDDLVRLGILSRVGSERGSTQKAARRPQTSASIRIAPYTHASSPLVGTNPDQEYRYLLTTYGLSFLAACHAPTMEHSNNRKA